jgi:hypothetical protein
MSASTRLSPRAYRFWDYFNAADEIAESVYAGLRQDVTGDPTETATRRTEWLTTLADLDSKMVARARRAADEFGFSWPPSLAEAEEYALAHHSELYADA